MKIQLIFGRNFHFFRLNFFCLAALIWRLYTHQAVKAYFCAYTFESHSSTLLQSCDWYSTLLQFQTYLLKLLCFIKAPSFDKSCTVLISIVTGTFDLYNIEHPPIKVDEYIIQHFFTFWNCALLFDNFCVLLFYHL